MAHLQQLFSRLRQAAAKPAAVPSGAPGAERRRLIERRATLGSLYSREMRIRCAAQEAGFGTYELDCIGGQVYWSPELRGIAGLPHKEGAMSGDRMRELIHPGDRERVMKKLQAAQDPRGDGEFGEKYRLLRPDGALAWVKAKGRTFFSGEGPNRRALGATGVVIDITERKRQEEKLLDSNEQLASRPEQDRAELGEAQEALESTNLEIQQFAYIAAHGMQTPLRSITGFAQLLKNEYHGRQLDSRAEIWLDQLVAAARRMHGLIQDLLTYSGVPSLGRPFEATDMNRIFDDVVGYAAAAIRESQASVTRDALPTVMGDPLQLATLLQNLIENGIKYRGRDPPRGHVSARRDGEEWVFSLQDNGIAIAEKRHAQIFDIFRRLHTQQAYAGTGIGLAICRRVVQRHGGRIWVESEPGVGSRFQFSLPGQ